MHPDAPLGFATINFDTRADFQAQILSAIRLAQREVLIADLDFRDWPLNSPELETALRAFFHISRVNQLHMLTTSANRLQQSAPRFMRVMRDFSHVLICRVAPDTLIHRLANDFSVLVGDQSILVRRYHHNQMRGLAEFNPDEASSWAGSFRALWDESTPGLSATTLGLSA